MKNDSSLKSPKGNNRLPSLHKSSSKMIFNQNSSTPKFHFQQKSFYRFHQHPKNIEQTKAHNFLNQTTSLCSPSVIMSVSDCVRKEHGKNFENNKEFSEENMIKSNFIKHFNPQKQNTAAKSMHVSNMIQGQFNQKQNKFSFQRRQVLNLAKWIDQKLQQFNEKKQISVQQIIDYKQHILNYGLGKIIDSVKKKSKQQGDLLKILWQNSFKVFQVVLQIISNSICTKQKTFLEEQNETKQIFDTNLQFLTTQNQKISAQLENIYEKMKKVIIWNKRLRKDKKLLNVQNRILEYRNQTYGQALQETVGMFLKAVPEPSTVNFAKKIIQKLARQKRRKKKSFQKNQVEQDFKVEAKQLVTSWLRRNGFNELDDEEIDPLIHLTNDQKLQLTKMDDDSRTNQVDIFEYFKLLDIGVQTDNATKNIACQYDIDLSTKMNTRGTLTQTLYKKNFQIQVGSNEVSFNQDSIRKPSAKKRTSKIVRSTQKKKSNISKFSQKSDKFKDKIHNKIQSKQNLDTKITSQQEKNIKFTKNGIRMAGKDGIKMYSRKQQDRQNSINKHINTSTNQLIDQKYYEKDFTVISQKKSEEFNFDSDEEIKNWNSDQFRVSISKLNGGQYTQKYELSKYEQFQSIHGRQASFKDFTQYEINEDQVMSDKNGVPINMKQLWKYMQNKQNNNTSEKNSRLSMNFIKIDNENYSMKKLQKKLFNQLYEQGKINSRSKEKQREKLFETVVRRRSFYKKGKVMFENSTDFEQSKQTKFNLYKSYIHYKPHNNKTITEIQAQEEEKVDQINKKMAIPSNISKSKTLAASKQMFKQLAETCKKTKKEAPKNKQYFNNTLISITKNVAALVQDYLRQIKREKDDIQTDFQKTYYPLHTILMDKMNWKYGLKDISEKKIKDFLEKLLTFAPVSEKISLYSLLFGMEIEGVGADQLLIYLKCLVYFEKKQPVSSSIHILKESNLFEKVNTDHEIVEQNIDKILKDFFDKQGAQIAKNQVLKYLEQNSKFLNIEKISQILIKSVLKRKQLFKKDAQFLYKICNKGKNIFTNFYKILKIYNNYNEINPTLGHNSKLVRIQGTKVQINLQNALKEFIRRSDVIDQIYGKSISFDRFLTAYMVTELPKEQEFAKTFSQIVGVFDQKYTELGTLKKLSIKPPKQSITKYCSQTVKFMEEVQKKWQIKGGQKPEQQAWQWNISKTVTEHVQNQLKSALGKLGIINNQIENFFFSLQNKPETIKE